MKRHIVPALALILPKAAVADETRMVAFDGSFDDAALAVESAIVGQGLVINFVCHVGDMLNRTGVDVGSDQAAGPLTPYLRNPSGVQFVSAATCRSSEEFRPGP